MQKSEIERQRLEQYVIVPDGVTAPFKVQCKGLKNEDVVTVIIPMNGMDWQEKFPIMLRHQFCRSVYMQQERVRVDSQSKSI